MFSYFLSFLLAEKRHRRKKTEFEGRTKGRQVREKSIFQLERRQETVTVFLL